MKILIIDNSIDREYWGSKDLCRILRQNPQGTLNTTTYVRRAPERDLPKDPSYFDRIIVSGSKTSAMAEEPWISDLVAFIQKVIQLKIPFLGVCYGHQMLARALGQTQGKAAIVHKAAQPEFGWTQITITHPSPLFEGLPKEFYSYSAHYDEVCTLPQGLKSLAKSEQCETQACQLESLPIFGIQFHPERNLADAERIFQRWKKIKNSPPLANYKQGKKLYNPKIGDTLFKTF